MLLMLQKCPRYMWVKQLSSITLGCPENHRPQPKENGEPLPRQKFLSHESEIPVLCSVSYLVSLCRKEAVAFTAQKSETWGDCTHHVDVVRGLYGSLWLGKLRVASSSASGGNGGC